MQAVRHINPPAWMTDYKSVKLMQILGAYEARPRALYVGGCVRNALMDRKVSDIDIATIHQPLQVIERLKNAGVRYVPTGLDHGTVTAIIEGAVFEITTLRRDIDTDGRYAVIAFTDQWDEDARRRDFTINTLLAAPDGAIYDPTGEGLNDIDKKRVVFVGDAAQRIAEDYLRILRFFRFHAKYGDGSADKEALAACRENADKISLLSKERITQEIFKVLEAPKAADTLDLMFSHNVLADIGKDFKHSVVDKLCDMQERNDAVDTMARLFAIAGMRANYFPERLILSNAQKKDMERLGQGLSLLTKMSKKKLRELVYRTDNATALQVYFLYLADRNKLPDIETMQLVRYWQPPVFPIKGDDLAKEGIVPGPMMGKKLKELEEAWIAKDFPAKFSQK